MVQLGLISSVAPAASRVTGGDGLVGAAACSPRSVQYDDLPSPQLDLQMTGEQRVHDSAVDRCGVGGVVESGSSRVHRQRHARVAMRGYNRVLKPLEPGKGRFVLGERVNEIV